jgi:hypothetical protein
MSSLSFGLPLPGSPVVKFLRGRRRFPLLPHKLLRPLSVFLREQSEVAHGIGEALSDERWEKAADALQRAAELLADASR